MPNHCKDCKWRVSSIYKGHFSCEQPKAKIGYGYSIKDMPADGLLIECDEGWAWYVGPEFGCVNFESKENNENNNIE